MTPITFRTHRGLYEQITIHILDEYGDEDFELEQVEQRGCFVGICVKNDYGTDFTHAQLMNILRTRIEIDRDAVQKIDPAKDNDVKDWELMKLSHARVNLQTIPIIYSFMQNHAVGVDYEGGRNWHLPFKKRTQAVAVSAEGPLVQEFGKLHVTDRV